MWHSHATVLRPNVRAKRLHISAAPLVSLVRSVSLALGWPCRTAVEDVERVLNDMNFLC